MTVSIEATKAKYNTALIVVHIVEQVFFRIQKNIQNTWLVKIDTDLITSLDN